MFLRIKIVCIVMLIAVGLLAQENTAVIVDDVLITSTSITSDFRDSLSTHTPIIEALTRESNLYLKTNGLGTSITSAYQGGNASHTTVLVNGIPVANPLIGQTDFSLLQTIPVTKAALVNDLNEGYTGAVAGSLSLETYQAFSPKQVVNYGMTAKTFHHWAHDLSISSASDKYTVLATATRLTSDNSYPFYIPELDKDSRQTHSRQELTEASIHLGYKINDQHTLQGFFWYNDQEREIPPTLTQTRSEQYQEDNFKKVGLSYTGSLGKYYLKSNYGYTDQTLLFVDGVSRFPAAFQQHYYSMNASRKLANKWTQSYTYALDRNVGQNHSYQSDQLLQTQTITVEVNRRTTKYSTQVIGQIIYTSLDNPWGFTWKISQARQLQRGSIKASIKKLWRPPSLNDLFWIGGGNEALLPESGYGVMLGYQSNQGKVLPIQVSLFSRWVDDYILWRPTDSSPVWQASNISTVWSRGMDFQLSYTKPVYKGKVSLLTKHQLAYSSSFETISGIGLVKAQQLIYTPIYTNLLILGYEGSSSSARLYGRSTSSYQGINETVEGSILFDASITQHIDLGKRLTLAMTLEVNNLLDNTYYIIERRPMPGRHGSLKLLFSCKQ